MTNLELLSPHCVQASYMPSQVPHFSGNLLIEALRPPLSVDDVLTVCQVPTGFAEEQRERPIEERLQMLKALERFMVPLERHVTLAMELDSMLLNGYVGREPATPEYVRRLHEIHGSGPLESLARTSAQELCATQQAKLLIGVSGMGKTRFVRRWAATFPNVIYHEAIHLYQIPTLHIELPSNGASVAGLCNAILREVDRRVPGAQYLETYALKGRPGAETLIQRVATVLHRHCVGMLICDEVQNLTNAGKGKKTVMTELVSMSNVLGLPLVFVGTNKAQDIFALDFRTSRRVCGLGADAWTVLDVGQVGDDGRVLSEFRDFAEVLWVNQWVREPNPLTEEMLQTLYFCSAGVIDTAIKIFADAQGRAMLDGTERVTPDLLLRAYAEDFKLLHPMLEALRKQDFHALASYDDIRPMAVTQLVTDLHRRALAKTSPAYTTAPGTPEFKASVAAALSAAGVDPDTALAAAAAVTDEGKTNTTTQATQVALQRLNPLRRANRRMPRKSAHLADEGGLDLSRRPHDLRNATQNAAKSGRTVLEELRALGMLKAFDDLLLVD